MNTRTSLLNIIGLKVEALKSYSEKKTKRQIDFILFDDKKTFIKLEEQDYYSFHDCSVTARQIYLRQDAEQWKNLNDNFLDANYDDIT